MTKQPENTGHSDGAEMSGAGVDAGKEKELSSPANEEAKLDFDVLPLRDYTADSRVCAIVFVVTG